MNRIASGQAENLVPGIGEPLIAPLVPLPLRDDVMLLWALDRRLAEQARGGREAALRQIRLRWWSGELAALTPGAVPSEPLLVMVAERLLGRIAAEELAALADAWESEAVGEIDPSGARGVLLFGLTARLLGQGDGDVAVPGRLWALVEQGLAGGEAALWAEAMTASAGVRLAGLPRSLAAVAALARSIARRGGERRRGREQLLVLRVGLTGR